MERDDFNGIGMCLALLMQASGTWLGMHMDQENPMNVFFGLFVYVGNTSGFALMLWFVYPAAGMLFAEIMKNVQDRDRFYKRILGLCVAVIISMISILPLIDYDIRNTYGGAGGSIISKICTLSCLPCLLS